MGISVEAYETKHAPIDPPDPIAAIKFRMENEGLTVADLTSALASRRKNACGDHQPP
jgi:HTH-type transcriptional regulator/antitoxin HigA